MDKKSICILDYGSGNVNSVNNLITFLNYKCIISNKDEDIINSSHLILPGVGSFGSSIKKIRENIPLDLLEDQVLKKGKPFIGICVGMQILANIGYEHGEFSGLGWIEGSVKKLNSRNLPLPHIGWNHIDIIKNSYLFKDLDEINDFYFVHSYFFDVKDESNIIATTSYANKFPVIIQKNNIFGIQFHPEKSQKAGIILLKNFINII